MQRWQYALIQIVVSIPLLFAINELNGWRFYVAVLSLMGYAVLNYIEGATFGQPRRKIINIYINDNEPVWQAFKRVAEAEKTDDTKELNR